MSATVKIANTHRGAVRLRIFGGLGGPDGAERLLAGPKGENERQAVTEIDVDFWRAWKEQNRSGSLLLSGVIFEI
jgi:hypothetical protein